MSSVFRTINSLVGSLVSLAVLGLLGYGGWTAYRFYYQNELALKQKQAEVERLTKEVQAKDRQIARLDMALRLLKVDHRVAQIVVVDQRRLPQTGRKVTRLRFVEVDDEGRELDQPREFTIEGDVVYIDTWVAKFDDRYVERGDDPLRATSVCLFRRLFGEYQEPQDGFPLDPIGSRPAAYSRGSEMSELEKEIWSNFWDYANDPKKAAAAGLRAVHGEAPSIKLRKGKLYKLLLRASGGLSFKVEELPAAIRGQRPL